VNILNTTFSILAFIAVILSAVTVILGMSTCFDDDDIDTAKKIWKISAIFFTIAAVCWLAFVFIPNKETLIEMQVAKLATPENAEMTVEKLKGVVDYIIEKAATLK
jgi:Na+/melibiose symporter-like transporter